MSLLLVAATLIWALVLVLIPAWRRARESRNGRRTVAGSGRSMRTLRSNHEVRRHGGRWVLVPYKPLGQGRSRTALRRGSF
ncbi:MAG TPA: hypothetical protein VFV09_02470 [Actinomycetota bacterium]|nr:hypothetical protein [Actinomycetota bacterium]